MRWHLIPVWWIFQPHTSQFDSSAVPDWDSSSQWQMMEVHVAQDQRLSAPQVGIFWSPVLCFPVVSTIVTGWGAVRIPPPHPSGVASAMGQEMLLVKDPQRSAMSDGMVLTFWCFWGCGKGLIIWTTLSSEVWKVIGPSPLPCFSVIISSYQWPEELLTFSLYYVLISGTRIQFSQFHRGSSVSWGWPVVLSWRTLWQLLTASPDKWCCGWGSLSNNISYWGDKKYFKWVTTIHTRLIVVIT